MSNGARFAAKPLAGGGTPVETWLAAAELPPMDLTGCRRLMIVAPHPDDETLGLGAAATQLAAAGVEVTVVCVSDGGAAGTSTSGLPAARRGELSEATALLGLPTPVWLGLPDGRLAEHEDEIGAALISLLDGMAPGTWCAATWRGDGHPDHEAVGRAAAVACVRTGTPLLEYPVWMWHWSTPSDPVVPWERARRIPLTDWALRRKHAAAQCFLSQLRDDSDEAVLPPFVVQRLLAVGEVVFG